MSTATVASWLLTYLVHSTVLLGAAWLVSRFLGHRRLALQEHLLRAALVGGLLTATVQVGLGVEPVGGALAVDGLTSNESIPVRDGVAVDAVGGTSQQPLYAPARALWPNALLALWVVGSTLALAVLGRSVLDLRRLLKTRRFRPAGRLLDRLAAAMGLRRHVRLSTSEAIAVPFATGIRRPEICCPERVGDLAREHRRSLFAHELAHLARRDPAWQLLYRIGEAILFLQPLNRVVRRRLEEIAEHLTDDRAVACTGDRLGLARCLVVIAHWGVSNPPGVPAAAFAAGPRLDRRVRHLISGGAGKPLDSRWTVPLVAVALAASVVFLPVISATALHANVSDDESNSLPAKTWSDASEAPPETPAPPAAPEVASTSLVAPEPAIAPMPETMPASDVVPATPAAPAPVAAPVSVAAPALEVAPVFEAVPAAPAASEPPRPEEPPTPVAPDAKDARRQHERARDEAKARHREAQREQSEAEARAREQARALREESRALQEQARELAREAAERNRLTDAEREKLRDEAREHARLSREQSRELAERSRAVAREAAERARLTDVEREELRRRAEAIRAESREQAREASRLTRRQARELAERARRLAEEAEAERQH